MNNPKLNPEAGDGSLPAPKPTQSKTKKKLYGVIGGAALAAAIAFGGSSILGHTPATYAQTATAPASPSPSTSSGSSTTPANGNNAATNNAAPGGRPGPRDGGPQGKGGPGGQGRAGLRGDVSGTISAISGNTLTLKRGEVIVIQATVNDSTVYTAAGKTIKLSDLTVGEAVSIRTTTATDGTISISAVEVVLDHAGGTISALDSGSLTLTRADNSTIKVTLGAAVSVQDLGKTVSLSDLKTGQRVDVAGTLNTDGTLSAQIINVQHDHLGGTVTVISGNTLTVEVGGRGQGGPEGRGPGQPKPAGNTGSATPAAGSGTTPSTGTATTPATTTKTITVSDSTTYLTGGQASQLSGIAVGDRIEAVGTASSDGNSLTALQVTVQLPHYQGQVTSVSGSTIVLQDRGTSRTIEVNSSTQYQNGQAAASLSDVKTGLDISVEGKVDASGNMTASVVQIGRPAGPPMGRR
jgi:hypothetical protein